MEVYSLQCTVQCAVYSVQCTAYSVNCTFFGNAGLVYWDLMLVLQLCNIVYDTPEGQVGFGGNERNPSLLVRDDQRTKFYGKALGVGTLHYTVGW